MEDASVFVDAINTLLALLPEQWKPHVEAALALLYVAGPVLAFGRWFLAKFFPRFAGSAPVVAADRALDYVVANSRRIEVRSNVVKARNSTLPPKGAAR